MVKLPGRAGPYGNIATVTRNAPTGPSVTASDPAYRPGDHALASRSKAINAADPLMPDARGTRRSGPRPVAARGHPGRLDLPGLRSGRRAGQGHVHPRRRRDAGEPADDFTPTPVLQAGTNLNIGDTNKNGLLDPGEVWLYTSAGVKTGLGTTPDWNQVNQDVINNTDTSGAGATPGFVHDPSNSKSTDTIFTGGQSKDTSGIGQWKWKQFTPQDKDDIADAFGAVYCRPQHRPHSSSSPASTASPATAMATVGFWFFQQPVSLKSDGTFSGIHTDGDILLVVDFSVGGSAPDRRGLPLDRERCQRHPQPLNLPRAPPSPT